MFSLTNLSVPVIQAPMAGGITTPVLVSEVSNAGGLGSFGFAYSSPEIIGRDLRLAQSLTQGPINANFFLFHEVTRSPVVSFLNQAGLSLEIEKSCIDWALG